MAVPAHLPGKEPSMNRRKFVVTSAALPFAAHSLLDGQTIRPDPNNAAPASDCPLLNRYHLTRDRVLHGAHRLALKGPSRRKTKESTTVD